MAQQAQLPIYYAVVHGAFELMPTGSFAPKSGTILIRYLPPMDSSNWKMKTLSNKIGSPSSAYDSRIRRLTKKTSPRVKWLPRFVLDQRMSDGRAKQDGCRYTTHLLFAIGLRQSLAS